MSFHNEPGVAYFNPPYFTPYNKPWLNGGYFVSEVPHPAGWDSPDTKIVLENLASGHIGQLLYTGSHGPELIQAQEWDLHWLVAQQDDLRRLQRAKATGQTVDFCIGARVTDAFLAVSGQTYMLTREKANGIVTGVTDLYYPIEVAVGGVDDDDLSSVTFSDSQTFTANESGLILIDYTPLHQVDIGLIHHTITDHNKMTIDVKIREMVQTSFGT